MAYNLGSKGLNKFKGVKKAIQEGDLDRAAFEVLDSDASSQALDRYAKISSTFGELPSAEQLSSTTSGKKLLARLQSQKESGSYVPEEYNYLLQEEVPMARPTNPEAGPSDTVPAMLTPGEAVIPAPAAQNPENKKQIAEMLNEGRVKNDIAEANGVPVTSPEVANIPKEEVGGGFFSNIKGALGFEGGTMEVPNMGMMIPPKDPTMDKMEQLAFKQMDYEMKSKNRTRDTVEKIGLKHLEDTATAEMKQMALDETMRNYGLEVPMPMAPVPEAQGFQDGTEAVNYGIPQMHSMDLIPIAPYNPEARAELEKRGIVKVNGSYQNILPVSQETRSSFSQPFREKVEAGQTLEPEEMSKVLRGTRQFDEADSRASEAAKLYEEIKPLQAAQQQELEIQKINNLNQQRRALGLPLLDVPSSPQVPPVATPPSSGNLDSSDVNVDDILSTLTPPEDTTEPTPPEEEEGIGSIIKSTVKGMFDPAALTKAAVAYGVNRAMGYDGDVASQQALQQYGLEQKRIAAAKAAAAQRQVDLEDYKTKELIKASIESPEKLRAAQRLDRQDQLAFNTRLRENLKATEQEANREIVKGKKTDKPLYNLGNTAQGFAAEATSFLRNSGIPIGSPETQDQMDSIINQSYRDMVAYQAETGNKASSIVPFIRQNLRASTLGASSNKLFELGKRDDGTSIQMEPRKSLNVDDMIDREVNRILKSKGVDPKKVDYPIRVSLRQRVFQDLQEDFSTFDQSKIKPGKDETLFYVFATKYYNK
jgi:hypothetical protein